MTKRSSLLDGAFKHGPDTAWRRIEDESVVLDLKTSAYFSLNETAAVLWEALGEGLTPRQAAERICERFDAELPAVTRDVETTIEELLSEGLIRRSDV